MKRISLSKLTVLSTVVMTHAALTPPVALAQSAGFSISPMVKRGDPSPDGGVFFRCIDNFTERISGSHAFNNRGAVGVVANTQLNCPPALFLLAPEERVRIESPCQEVPLGRFIFANDLNINNQGQGVFAAGWSKDGINDVGLLYYSQSQLTTIAILGDPTPVGTFFRGCGFSEPSINSAGEVAFGACSDDGNGTFLDGIFSYVNGEVRKAVLYGDPSPLGGFLALNFLPAITPVLNDNSDILFHAGSIIDITVKEKFGLFLATKDGVKKIVVDGDPMPNGTIVFPGSLGIGDLNNKSEVAFTVKLQGSSDSGIFLNSGGTISKIVAQGDPTPIGGVFSTLEDPDLIERFLFVRPRIDNNGAVLFKAKVGQRIGLFLASPRAMLKVVTVGDELPGGGTVRLIDSFALNGNGQVAFFAYAKKDPDLRNPLGVYVATPSTPHITSIKLKSKKGALQLSVNGDAMITNDTVIEINGVPLSAIDYPSDFREDGGVTTRVVSRDSRLEQLIPSGQTVQITVYNSLTNLRSAARMSARN